MNLQFEYAIEWLWMLVLVTVVVVIALSRRGSMPAVRLYTSAVLRILVVLLLFLAMANPVQKFTRFGRQCIIFLLDQSNSINESAKDRALAMMSAINNLRTGDDITGLITFAGTPDLTISPGKVFEIRVPRTPADTDATDIASAIEFGINLFPSGSARTLVLFSDGNETERSARVLVDMVERQEVVIHSVPLARKTRSPWHVDRLIAPSRVKVGERFRLRALLTSDAEKAIQTRVVLRKNGVPVNERVDLMLQPGVTPVTMDYKLMDTGLHAFDLTVTHETGYTVTPPPTFIEVTGMPRVLIVGPDATGPSFFGEVIQRRSFTIDERPLLPETLKVLLQYDCIILNDVDRSVLTDARIRMLQQYVQDFGGGVVTIGGNAEAGLEAFADTPLEELLPIELAQRHTIDKKRRDFVLMLLIDRSGSMDGEKLEMAKAAAINAVQELEAGDSIGIIAFDDEAHRVVDLTVLDEDKSAVIEKVRRLTPGGGTDARMALVEAYRIFSSKKINIRKHIILMTDGITTQRQLMDITRRVADRGITISTIAIGTDANIPILEQMRQIGQGAFHLITNFRELPRIVVGDMDEQVKEADDIDKEFTPEIFHDSPILSGIRQDDIPSLKGYVASRLKIAATNPLMTNFKNTADPILAHWYYGLGRSTVMTAGVHSSWSEEWLKWRNFGKLWEQIIRWTMRKRSQHDYFFHIHHDGNRLRMRVEVEYEDATLPSSMRGSLRMPDNRVVTTPFRRVDGNVFEGAFAVTDSGTAHLALLEEGRNDQAMWFGQVYLPGIPASPSDSRELDGRPPDYRLLQDIASATGGIFDPQPADVIIPPLATVNTRALRNPLLILAMILFLMDVAARRVDIPFVSILARWRARHREFVDAVRKRLPS